jgi:hypothetical protein
MAKPVSPASWLRRVLVAAAALACLSTGPASAQNGFAGTTRDPVTGWHCVTPFCDTLIMPGTRCLCQKHNPNETRLARLRFTCIPPTGSQQGCPLPRGVGGN